MCAKALIDDYNFQEKMCNSKLTVVQSMYAIHSTAIIERAAIIRRISHVLHSRELQFLSFSSRLRVTTGHTYPLIHITRRQYSQANVRN